MRRPQPLDKVEWVSRDSVKPNAYNPNHVPPPELRLLRISILQDGWTQPVVVHRATMTVVDGEHRWTVGGDPEVAAMTDGKIPVVFVEGDEAARMMSTIRHNRARGEHLILPMGDIVNALLKHGHDKSDVCFLLQMEDEEIERLTDRAGMTEKMGRGTSEFNQGWVPG